MKRKEKYEYHGCRTISELLNNDCTPLLDVLFKLSSIASNFASAANNTKNISVADKHEIEELLNLVFDVRKLAEKVEKLLEERIENDVLIIRSGVFEAIMMEEQKQACFNDSIESGDTIGKLVLNNKKENKKT